jgi:hypothetical protein
VRGLLIFFAFKKRIESGERLVGCRFITLGIEAKPHLPHSPGNSFKACSR